jgi:hypothetical protein
MHRAARGMDTGLARLLRPGARPSVVFKTYGTAFQPISKFMRQHNTVLESFELDAINLSYLLLMWWACQLLLTPACLDLSLGCAFASVGSIRVQARQLSHRSRSFDFQLRPSRRILARVGMMTMFCFMQPWGTSIITLGEILQQARA